MKYKLGHEVVGVRERSKKGVRVAWKEDNKEVEGTFDELILAVGESWSLRAQWYRHSSSDADSALKLLGKTATWREKQVLGSVLYL